MNRSAYRSYITIGSPSVCPGKILPSEAASVNGLPDLSQILKAVFQEFRKWLGPTAPVGSVGVEPELAASNVSIRSLAGPFVTCFCFCHNGSSPFGSPLPGTDVFFPHLFGLNSFDIFSAGINVPLAICEAIEGTSIIVSEVMTSVAFCSLALSCACSCSAKNTISNAVKKLFVFLIKLYLVPNNNVPPNSTRYLRENKNRKDLQLYDKKEIICTGYFFVKQ